MDVAAAAATRHIWLVKPAVSNDAWAVAVVAKFIKHNTHMYIYMKLSYKNFEGTNVCAQMLASMFGSL